MTSSSTGLPLSDVCISAGVAGGCTWKTDVTGAFTTFDGFSDLPAGQWDFFFQKSGLTTKKVTTTLTGGQITTINVQL